MSRSLATPPSRCGRLGVPRCWRLSLRPTSERGSIRCLPRIRSLDARRMSGARPPRCNRRVSSPNLDRSIEASLARLEWPPRTSLTIITCIEATGAGPVPPPQRAVRRASRREGSLPRPGAVHQPLALRSAPAPRARTRLAERLPRTRSSCERGPRDLGACSNRLLSLRPRCDRPICDQRPGARCSPAPVGSARGAPLPRVTTWKNTAPSRSPSESLTPEQLPVVWRSSRLGARRRDRHRTGCRAAHELREQVLKRHTGDLVVIRALSSIPRCASRAEACPLPQPLNTRAARAVRALDTAA